MEIYQRLISGIILAIFGTLLLTNGGYSLWIVSLIGVLIGISEMHKLVKSTSLRIIMYILFINTVYQFINNSHITLIIAVLSDIACYVSGKCLGGPKLTRFSPNKTISGSLGGLLSSIFVGYFLNLSITISLCYGISSQLGDLLTSILKRYAKIKDTGNLIPGHGGLLDRLDSLIGTTFMSFILNLIPN
jgi:phosphatidate cytidylyltransferase